LCLINGCFQGRAAISPNPLLAAWAVQKIEHDPWRQPFVLNNLLDTAQVKNVFAPQHHARLIAQLFCTANIAPTIFMHVFEQPTVVLRTLFV